jgi:hypothetical protein
MDANVPNPDIELTTVFRTGEPDVIAMATSLLQAEGIDFFIRGENVQHLFGSGGLGAGYNFITGPAEFVVRVDDAVRARDVLRELERTEAD